METKKRILIADDSEDVRKMLAIYLSRNNGYEIEQAASPTEALQKLADAEASPRKFDLVISDHTFNGSPLDGIDLLRRMHGRKQLAHVAFILFSGEVEPANPGNHLTARALREGADAVFAKPLMDFGPFLKAIENVLSVKTGPCPH